MSDSFDLYISSLGRAVRLLLALPTRSDIRCFRLKGRRPTGIARSVTGLRIPLGRDPLTNQERFTFGFSALEEAWFYPCYDRAVWDVKVFRAVGRIEGRQPDRITAGPFRPIRSLGIVLRHFPTFLQSLLTGRSSGLCWCRS